MEFENNVEEKEILNKNENEGSAEKKGSCIKIAVIVSIVVAIIGVIVLIVLLKVLKKDKIKKLGIWKFRKN